MILLNYCFEMRVLNNWIEYFRIQFQTQFFDPLKLPNSSRAETSHIHCEFIPRRNILFKPRFIE